MLMSARHFAPHPAPLLPVPPHPNHQQQFNIEFHHHQMEQMQVRNDLLQRQAREAFHQQQIQLQLQLQEAERVNRQAHNDLVLQEYEAEQVDRHEQDVLRAQQQEEEDQRHRTQRIHEQQEHQQEAMCEYNLPASQEHHDDDEERRRIQLQADREEHEEEDQRHINQVVPIPDGGCPYREPIILHYLGHLDVECPNCHAMHFISKRLSNSSIRTPRFGMCCLQGQVSLLPFPQWPPELQEAYMDRTFVSKI